MPWQLSRQHGPVLFIRALSWTTPFVEHVQISSLVPSPCQPCPRRPPDRRLQPDRAGSDQTRDDPEPVWDRCSDRGGSGSDPGLAYRQDAPWRSDLVVEPRIADDLSQAMAAGG